MNKIKKKIINRGILQLISSIVDQADIYLKDLKHLIKIDEGIIITNSSIIIASHQKGKISKK